MGIYDRDYYRTPDQGWKIRGFETVWATLVAINVAIFLVDSFAFKGSLSASMAVRTETLMQPLTWWRFLTAGFAHSRSMIMHIVGNMLALFFFGREIEAMYGGKKFLAFYLTAIVLGNIGFSLRHEIMDIDRAAIGASGAIVSIVILFALKFPHRVVLLMMAIPVPAWLLGVIYVVSDFAGALNPNSPTAHDIHLIGAAYGFLFYRTGWDISSLLPAGKRFSWRLPKKRPRVRLYDPGPAPEKLDQQADAILDKLHREGESSLTNKERRVLEEYSRRMREKRR